MEYKQFKNEKLSALGFGTMRYPLNEDKSINAELAVKLIRTAYENGINYFDTAWPYHDGKSEGILADALSVYPRESYYIADKMPGHQFMDPFEPEKIFEAQFKRLNTDHIDFYLLHNVNDSCMDTYMDEEIGLIRYLSEQREKGRIKYLGFSTHATVECLQKFFDYLDEHGYKMDFVQIQLNYLDWTLQNGRKKVAMFNERDLPIMVMEPCRGGKLASLSQQNKDKLSLFETGRSDASWSFRWLMDVPGVTVILSGMSSMEQLTDNIDTFNEYKLLSENEKKTLSEIAAELADAVPCTGCRYCVDYCPMGIDIPFMMDRYNEYRFDNSLIPAVLMESRDKNTWPDVCIRCGACAAMCPQHIDIPDKMEKLSEFIKKGINWRELCEKRNAISKA